MNPFQKLLQSISGSGIQRAAGLIDTLGAPIQRSVGNIRDILEKARPNSKGQQQFSKLTERPINFSRSLSPLVIKTNFEDPVQRFFQEYGNKLPPGVTDTAASLKPTSTQVGGVGGLIQNLNKLTPAGAVKLGLKLGGTITGIGDVILTGYKGSVQQNELGGLLSPTGAAYGAARMLTGGPFSLLPEIMDIEIPRTSGTQTKKGTLDTGRYIPGDQQKTIFTKQFDPAPPVTTPPVNSGSTQAGALNTGAGTPDQRRVIEERNYQTQLSNAKQQYATPDPMSSDFQGYPNELAAQYGLEQSYGQELKQAGTLVPQLQEAGAGAGMTPENFAAWAKANPGLAVRLLSQGQRN